MTHVKHEKPYGHEAIKKDILEWFKFFEPNIRRYKRSMRFSFKETLSDMDRKKLNAISKPAIEVNYVQAFLSRLLGEFSKQAPEIEVSGSGQSEEINIKTIDLVEGHLRDMFDQFKKKGYTNQVLKEQCGGSFSVLEIFTDYINDETFDQYVGFRKSNDPTMCFFDPMAKLPSKSDGRYCGKIYPITLDAFKKKYPKFADKADAMRFNAKDQYGGDSPFSWSYRNMTVDIILLAESYYVDCTPHILCKLADNKSMLLSDYNKMLENWEDIAPPPDIIKKRKIESQKIKRYLLFGEDIIEKEETSLPGLPHVFVDGNSAFVYKQDEGGEIEQVTHSYIHNAIDAQKMLNFTCQTIANYSENYMQQKFIVDERAIVDEDSWTSPQTASVLIKRSIDGQGVPIPDPAIPIHQSDLPASIMDSFHFMQQVIQNTLGSHDAQLGVNRKDLSGSAIEKGDMQNNAAVMPFHNSYLDALNTIAELSIKMFPKYYVTPMTIPYTNIDGERTYRKINQVMPDGSVDPESAMIDYKENDLGVNVKSGHSFSIQKDISLKMIISLSEVVPSIKALLDTPEGASAILDNVDVKSIDKLKNALKKLSQQQQAQPSQPNPAEQQMMLKQQELALKKQENEMNFKIKLEEINIKKQQMESNQRIAELQFQKGIANDAVQNAKVSAEISTHAGDNAAKLADHILRRRDQEHKHAVDLSHKHHRHEN